MHVSAVSIGVPYDSFAKSNPIYEDWNGYLAGIKDASPTGVNKIIISGGEPWAWMATEPALVRGAVLGMIIAIIFAFGLLLFSTMNLIISIFSTVAIVGIVSTVVTVMQFN